MAAQRTKGEGETARTLTAGVLASLAPLPLSALTPERVGEWLEAETPKRGTQAALAFRLLRAFINWCEEQQEYRGISLGKDEDAASAGARILSQPEVRAASVVQMLEGDSLDLDALVVEMKRQAAQVHGGSLERGEAMLIAQAHTLDALFSNLARRSLANMHGGNGEAAERYMRIALKAQSQCRTTLEALAEIKNPRPVAFVKQANISNGPQQVNNGIPDPAHAGEIINQANELSGVGNELLPDTRTSQAARRINQEVEAMGEIHRATNR